MRAIERPAIHLLLIVFFGLIAYSNTFDVPFVFDDHHNIIHNPLVKDPHFNVFGGRYFGYLSFSFNYFLNGHDVRGYHYFNTAVHIINALLIYLIVHLVFRAPLMLSSPLMRHSGEIALFSGLLFVTHPIETQAVTYIVQRFTSMATMFYLISIALYAGFRLGDVTEGKRRRVIFYILAVLSAFIAIKTKKLALTLPLSLTVFESMFLEGPSKKRAIYLLPFFLITLIVPLSIAMHMESADDNLLDELIDTTRLQSDTSRLHYLYTQFGAIATYLRLLFFPTAQNFDHDYPIRPSFLDPQVYLPFLLLLSLAAAGLYLLYRSRRTDGGLKLVSFGIFWFFITLAITSSVFPIADVMFEHRAYLPSIGVFLSITTGAFLLAEKLPGRRTKTYLISTLFLITLVLSYAAYSRNTVWESRISLWEDVVKKSPGKARAHYGLGNAYQSEGLIDKAIERYHIALRLKPDYMDAHNNLGNAYRTKGLFKLASLHLRIALRLKPDFAKGHYNLGIVFTDLDLPDKAIKHFQTALSLNPDIAEAHNNLGVVYKNEDMLDKAIEHFRTALSLNPDYTEAHNNLGNAYRAKGLPDKAIEHLKIALRLKPDYADAYNNLGIAYSTKGMFDEAVRNFQTALELRPDSASAHFNLGLAYLGEGLTDEAYGEFETALQINPDHKASIYLNRLNREASLSETPYE